jgi:2-polyprenyl-3-methyl-5-hydroxy-6-metoxy-1,4-benzoquinol methylase
MNDILENLRDLDSYRASWMLFKVLSDELEFHRKSRKYLDSDEFRVLQTYYSNWIKFGNTSIFGHYFALRLEKAVDFVKTGAVEILDCGCGLGSESIALGLLGSRVTGIDLNKERVSIAQKRIRYYNEVYKIKLHVNVFIKNLWRYKPKSQLDLIHAKESVSHVSSLQAFLGFVRESLRSQGHLIITDANPFNPVAHLKAYLEHRKKGLFTYAIDPETGQKIPYAIERLISPYHLKTLFRKYGLGLESMNYYGYVPPNFMPSLYVVRAMDKAFRKLPLGAIYVITGTKT